MLLLMQWASKDLQAVPDNPTELAHLLRRERLTPKVRAKFTSITIDGHKYLRNQRLAREWANAQHITDTRRSAAQKRWAKNAHAYAKAHANGNAKHGANGHAKGMTSTTTSTTTKKIGITREA